MKTANVIFAADYMTLTTSVPVEGSMDDVLLALKASEQIKSEYGFDPSEFAFEVTVENGN